VFKIEFPYDIGDTIKLKMPFRDSDWEDLPTKATVVFMMFSKSKRGTTQKVRLSYSGGSMDLTLDEIKERLI
jgi:hypothetical protein